MDPLFEAQLMDGQRALCPCCSRTANLAQRRVHSALAMMLCQLYKKSMLIYARPDGFVHLDEFKTIPTAGNDFSIVGHWKLAKPAPKDLDHGISNWSGFWGLTDRGCEFVEGKLSIEKSLWIFDDRVMKKSEQTVGVQDCLGSKFDYNLLFAVE